MNELEAVAQLVNVIQQRRTELGWTQQELADKVGLHWESIARIENGGSVPRLDTVLKLAFAGYEDKFVLNPQIELWKKNFNEG
ncbi:helix-turn-helix transcriptional regulator [Paenibacillus lentus]|uniref:helix-turn-helix transcriptional regulator n=1 Tax=Paenibacillus lentus TaxID=1338368 RepID=UPI003659137C